VGSNPTLSARQRPPSEGMRKLAVVLVLAAALGGAGTALGLGAARGAFGGCGFPERSDCLRILFIGNSYTAVNDLPGTFARLARSPRLAVDASSIAPGGQTLADHAADPDVRNAIAGTPWTGGRTPGAERDPGRGAEPRCLDGARRRDARRGRPGGSRDARPVRDLGASGRLAGRPAGSRRDAGGDRPGVRADRGVARGDGRARRPGVATRRSRGALDRALAGRRAASDNRRTYLAAAVLLRTITGRTPLGLAESDGQPAADAATLQRVADGTIP
jgi:hypothetical protein